MPIGKSEAGDPWALLRHHRWAGSTRLQRLALDREGLSIVELPGGAALRYRRSDRLDHVDIDIAFERRAHVTLYGVRPTRIVTKQYMINSAHADGTSGDGQCGSQIIAALIWSASM